MNGLYIIYVKRVVRKCKGEEKTKVNWLIKGFKNKIQQRSRKTLEKNDCTNLQNKIK
jgi:hypothetical protein